MMPAAVDRHGLVSGMRIAWDPFHPPGSLAGLRPSVNAECALVRVIGDGGGSL